MFLIDGHSDLLNDVYNRRRREETHVLAGRYVPRFRAGGITGLILSIFLPDDLLDDPLRHALEMMAYLHEELAESPDELALCHNGREMTQAMTAGKIALMVSFEGAEPITSLPVLQVFYQLGVRGIGLAWSRQNQAADGSRFQYRDQGGGLTEFGRDLLKEAARLGMFIDLSHLSDEGVADVFALWRGVVLASHSNTRHLVPIPRNLSDEQLRSLKAAGGSAGLNGTSTQICPRGEQAGYAALLDHCDHMIRHMGEDHVTLGFDLCDEIFRDTLSASTGASFDVVRDYDQYPAFLEAMRQRGYDEVRIAKIAAGNLLRQLDQLR